MRNQIRGALLITFWTMSQYHYEIPQKGGISGINFTKKSTHPSLRPTYRSKLQQKYTSFNICSKEKNFQMIQGNLEANNDHLQIGSYFTCQIIKCTWVYRTLDQLG